MSEQIENLEKWYNKKWLVATLCILFFPIGIYALWKSEVISKAWKITNTIIIGLIIFASLFKNDSIDPSVLNSKLTLASSQIDTLNFLAAERILEEIPEEVDETFKKQKLELLSKISGLRAKMEASFGKYSFSSNGIEVIMMFGKAVQDSSLFCQIRAFNGGVPISGITSDGRFFFDPSISTFNVQWELAELNKSMSSISIGESSITLINGTVYKKISADYSSEIKPSKGSASSVGGESSSSSAKASVKVVCESTWESVSELRDMLESISYDWEQMVSSQIQSEYREFIDDAWITGANSNGILLKAKGNVTGAEYKVLWTCDGSIVVYDATASDY